MLTNDLEFDMINELSLRSRTKAPAGTLEAGRTEQKPEGFRSSESFQKTFEKKLKKFLTKQSGKEKI